MLDQTLQTAAVGPFALSRLRHLLAPHSCTWMQYQPCVNQLWEARKGRKRSRWRVYTPIYPSLSLMANCTQHSVTRAYMCRLPNGERVPDTTICNNFLYLFNVLQFLTYCNHRLYIYFINYNICGYTFATYHLPWSYLSENKRFMAASQRRLTYTAPT